MPIYAVNSADLWVLVFLKKFDIGVKFVTSPEPEAFAEAIDDNTRAIYIESIGNPKNTVALLPEIAKVDAMGRFLPHVGITDLFGELGGPRSWYSLGCRQYFWHGR